MNKRTIHKTILLPLLMCLAVVAVAQNPISATATVDKNRILIGEHIELLLKVDIPENEAIRFFSVDSIPHFEILEKQPIDTSNTSHGTRLTQVIRLTSFDSGQWVIPSFVLAENITTDSLTISVGFSPFDPNQPYHDIKDVIDVPEKKKSPWWWYVAGGGVLLLIMLLIILLRKKTNPPAKTTTLTTDPFKEAMSQLELLQKQKTGGKEYYSSLIDIFRLYVYRQKGIRSLQKTTDDLVLQLGSLRLDKKQFDKLAQTLRLSDYVKFAKYQPAMQDDLSSFDTIRQTIIIIEQSEKEAFSAGKSQGEV